MQNLTAIHDKNNQQNENKESQCDKNHLPLTLKKGEDDHTHYFYIQHCTRRLFENKSRKRNKRDVL